jgi:glycosyltransferase involved in cell wall biosynthesis
MPLDIAVLGTRGIPANYGGFETFAEELSVRLALRGHRVTVYGRSHYVPVELTQYRDVRLRRIPAVRSKYFDTVSHSAICALDVIFRPFQVVLICNAANSFMSWVPRLRGQKVVLNVDGIERLRKKWNALGRGFYRISERLATWFPHCVVTDALTIRDYYRARYGVETTFIPYGAPVERAETTEILDRLGLEPGQYLLYVSRFEPENNAHLVIQGYLQSGVDLPLVLVGDAPYSDAYKEELRRLATGGNILMPGAIYGTGYRELISHCHCYLHGTEVGGTHPALLEAMGAGALAIVHATPENLEVIDDAGLSCRFEESQALGSLIRGTFTDREKMDALRRMAQDRVRCCYNWDRVTDAYEELMYGLVG